MADSERWNRDSSKFRFDHIHTTFDAAALQRLAKAALAATYVGIYPTVVPLSRFYGASTLY